MGAQASGTTIPTSRQRDKASIGWRLLSFALLFLFGLALSRLLYEWQFPAWVALGRPLPAILLGAAVATSGALLGRRTLGTARGALMLLPCLLVLGFLFDPVVDLARSRFLVCAAVWLVVVGAVWGRYPAADRRWRWLGPMLLLIALVPVYLLTMSHAVGEADTFEFQVVAPQLGIAHPTGYPLYLLLGKGFSLLPVDTVAWRLNLASAVYACLAACVVYWTALRLLRQPLAALLGALALGLSPVFWGQAIVAEVYTLHALVVAIALYLIVRLVERPAPDPTTNRRLLIALAAVIGLGLTNHLTTVFLIPPAIAAGLLLLADHRRTEGTLWPWPPVKTMLWLAAAFMVPLLLYAYLPLRWQAVNDEPMGMARFVDWVVAGRFQGALQWSGWLRDPARFQIVGRLLLDNWGGVYLATAALGLVYLLRRSWRTALVLAVTFLGFTFYTLNYYVPDLAVFLIPSHVVVALLLAAGVAGLMALAARALDGRLPAVTLAWGVPVFCFFLLALPAVLRTAAGWSALDQSARDGGETWGRAVLAQPLSPDAAVLADSEKIAPLYYLQQNEGLRPDLEIMVLPDEAAYRTELDQRVAAGQTVYLARFLPGLAGSYSLRSAGPLVEVGVEPLVDLPPEATDSGEAIGPLELRGYTLESPAAVDEAAAAVTLYWSLAEPLPAGSPPLIYLRWRGQGTTGPPIPLTGQHAVDNLYPANAWRPGELVADYHLLPFPAGVCRGQSCEIALEVAVGPPYSAAAELPWTAVTRVTIPPLPGPVSGAAWRSLLGPFALDAAAFPAQIRPGAPLSVDYSGFYGTGATLSFALEEAATLDLSPSGREQLIVPLGPPGDSQRYAAAVETDVANGRYALVARSGGAGALCGWLAPLSSGCNLGEVVVSGAALPEGATNFDDQLALLDIDLPRTVVEPSGQLPLTLTWQGLAPMTEDYTVFVQVLDSQDRLVGQVDGWPVQGTFPTSAWTPGETVVDPYVVQLASDLPSGEYRLHVGLYLLATSRRLPVLDATGAAIDDKVEVGGLVVP